MASNRMGRATCEFGSRTDVGCVREHNEDSLAVEPPLYVVCDGMGGHAAGEVASEIAVDVIAKRAPLFPDANALGQAVEEANLAIMRAAHEGVGREGMGCTCTAAMIENERLVVAQVGDSRAYLLHQGHMQQLTRDHSLMADLIDAGQITPAEARVHPKRSVITRALGSDPHTQPDLFEINVQTGDRLLLCSDGLTSMVEDELIESILNKTPDPQLAASKLVNAAIAAGGHDNVTVIVVNIAGFAEVRRKKVARKTKITVALLAVLLVAAFSGAGYALNYWLNNSAFLGEQEGKVVVYQGVPGELLGMSFSHVSEVTDIKLADLQPGVANRIKDQAIRTTSLEEAQELVRAYREEIEGTAGETPGSKAVGEASASSAASSASAGAADAAGTPNAAGAPSASENSRSAGSPNNESRVSA